MDIRESIEQAIEQSEASEVESAPQNRDEGGKFASKEDKPVEVASEAKPESNPEVNEVAQAPAVVERRAPSSWKPAAQEAFLKAERGEALAPEEIKMLTAEAERRESDYHKGISEYKSHSERARSYDSAVAPYQPYLQSLGVDAPTAIQNLLQAEYTLRNGDPQAKINQFMKLAQEYGIDLNQTQNIQPQDPQTQYLTNQLNELRQTQQMWQNQLQQQQASQAQAELSQFADGREHFDAVRNEMALLMETGDAKTLQEAYEKAVWMQPDVRQTLLDKQLNEALSKALAQAQAQKAKTASIGVKGSSPSSAGIQPVKGSLRDVIAASFDAYS
jgi:hypothetical protein